MVYIIGLSNSLSSLPSTSLMTTMTNNTIGSSLMTNNESGVAFPVTVSLNGVGNSSNLVVGSGRRANRTRFTDFQLRTLQNFFDRQAYPKDDDLEMLSKKLGLSPRVIVVWFQNARQKARKIYENQPNVSTNEGTTEQFIHSANFQCKRCQLAFQHYYELTQHQQSVCYLNDNDVQQNDNKVIFFYILLIKKKYSCCLIKIKYFVIKFTATDILI